MNTGDCIFCHLSLFPIRIAYVFISSIQLHAALGVIRPGLVELPQIVVYYGMAAKQ
jgi:hypothetical protein